MLSPAQCSPQPSSQRAHQSSLSSALIAWIVPLIILCAPLSPSTSHAEGMWQPDQLPALQDELRRRGLNADLEELADLQAGPLSAVIYFNGCSASFVSALGLIITNHHCAVGALQHNSTAEANLFEDGFTAEGLSDERWAGPNVRARVAESAEDVTAQIQGALAAAGEDDHARYQALSRTRKALVQACEASGAYCRVASYDGGDRYVLTRELELKDIRLVHAPPRAVGQFGGEVDNWMWPRHTGDWALFRAYVAPGQRPATYSAENEPYRPRRFLKVSGEGIGINSWVMVAGYPGSTYRYRSARELAYMEQTGYPETLTLLGQLLAIAEEISNYAGVEKDDFTCPSRPWPGGSSA